MPDGVCGVANGNTAKDRDCAKMFWFDVSENTLRALDEPCFLLENVDTLEGLIEYNDKLHLEAPETRESWAKLRSAALGEAHAARELAAALREGDESRISIARKHALEATENERKTMLWHGKQVCGR